MGRGLVPTRGTEVEGRGDTSDAELVARASAGEIEAFEVLYRRHVASAWRVALAVTGNAEDAADAASDAFIRVFQSLRLGRLEQGGLFRSYLVAAARNAAVDVLRRTGRLRPTDTAHLLDAPTEWPGPWETMVGSVDSSLVASAFLSLPERWRWVLWLTEVEGIPPKEAAAVLGVSPNGVAQLAVRARAGLRERFLQAHLGDHDVHHECRRTVDRLGAYAAGGLAPREIAKVDQHLAGCESCPHRLAELEDLGSTLRRVAVPLPVGLAALGVKWRMAASAAEAAAPAGTAGASGAGGSALLLAQKPLVMATAALFAVGAAVVGSGAGLPGAGSATNPSSPGPGAVAAQQAAGPTPVVAGAADGDAATATPTALRARSTAPTCPAATLGPVTAALGGLTSPQPATAGAVAPGIVPEPAPTSAAALGVPVQPATAHGVAPAVPAAPPLPEDVAGTAPAAAVAPTAGASGVGPGAPACIVTPVPGDTSGCALPNAGSAANAAAESMTARGGADAPQQAEGLLSGEEDAKRLAPENLGRPCSSGTAGP